jgi:hypothetical protein
MTKGYTIITLFYRCLWLARIVAESMISYQRVKFVV